MAISKKPIKYSYSRLNSYEQCGWKYKLIYEDKHFFFSDSIASMFGTLVHYIEEKIGNCLKDNIPIDYNKLKDDFLHINIPKTSKYDLKGGVFGVDTIKEKFPKEFFEVDEDGHSYSKRVEEYLNTGIYRLENYLKANPDLVVQGTELSFEISYENDVLTGSIDRVLFNTKTNKYIIEDIKTKAKPFKEEDLKQPLQFVFYTLALSSMLNIKKEDISCRYDLPFCNIRQDVIEKDYVKKGEEEIKNILSGIADKTFVPQPSASCAFCSFSPTNSHQPDGAKKLCPYYSLWVKGGDKKVRDIAHKWDGIANHEKAIREVYEGQEEFDFEF